MQRGELTVKGHRSDRSIVCLDHADGYHVYTCAKLHYALFLKWVHFIAYKL